MRYNLNTVDYSVYSTEALLVKLNNLRRWASQASPEDSNDYEDKAEDIWSILKGRKEADPVQFNRVDELYELADRGSLTSDDLEALEEGVLP